MALRLSTETVARRSARRPWTTIGIWVLVFVVAIGLNATLFEDVVTTQFVFTNTPESQRGVDLIEDLRGVPLSTNEVVIVQADTIFVDHPFFERFVVGLSEDITALGPDIIREGTFTNYYQSGADFLVSEDRRTTIMPLTMAGDFDDATDNIPRVIEAR